MATTYAVDPGELAKVRKALIVEVDGRRFARVKEEGEEAVYFESADRYIGDGAVVTRIQQGRARIIKSE